LDELQGRDIKLGFLKIHQLT